MSKSLLMRVCSDRYRTADVINAISTALYAFCGIDIFGMKLFIIPPILNTNAIIEKSIIRKPVDRPISSRVFKKLPPVARVIIDS